MDKNKNAPKTENTAKAEDSADKNTSEFKSSKYQTLVLIGIGLIILGIIFVIIALYQPTVSSESSITVSIIDMAESADTQGITDEYESGATTESADQTQYTSAAAASYGTTESAASAAQTSAGAGTTSGAYSTASSGTTAATTTAEATAAATTAETALQVSYPLNLNTCTQAELETLDGIGESRAYAIISYREYLGGYTSTEQIKDIKGIGDGIYEKIKDYITV